MLHEAPLSPKPGAFQRSFLITPSVVKGGALIESEDDVGAQLVLDLHRYLGCKSVHRAIEVGLKGDSIIVHMSKSLLIICNNLIRAECLGIHGNYLFKAHAQGENLKSAAIGESGSGPIHE